MRDVRRIVCVPRRISGISSTTRSTSYKGDFMLLALALVLFAGIAKTAHLPAFGSVIQPSQVAIPSPPTAVDWAADDGKRVARLTATGEHIEGTNVIVWMPSGTLSRADQQTLVNRLDLGVASLRKIVGVHDWQAVKDGKITYYISEEQFVSHATGRAAVFIPVARVQDGRAPYLHETTHELLARRMPAVRDPARAARIRLTSPLWLTEGLADYIAQLASSKSGFPEGDVFAIGGLAGADTTCANRLKASSIGDEVIKFMGGPGAPEVLFTTDRQTMAPTFYACALSFTKYVASQIGLDETIKLIPQVPLEGVQTRIEELTRKPISTARDEWLRSIR
jgi:hypothetical protein